MIDHFNLPDPPESMSLELLPPNVSENLGFILENKDNEPNWQLNKEELRELTTVHTGGTNNLKVKHRNKNVELAFRCIAFGTHPAPEFHWTVSDEFQNGNTTTSKLQSLNIFLECILVYIDVVNIANSNVFTI